MKRNVKLCMVATICMMLVGCGKVDYVNKAEKAIDNVFSEEKITQDNLDAAFEAYDKVSDNEKEKVSNYAKLAPYKDVNIDKINNAQSLMDNFSLEVEQEELVSNINIMQEMMKGLNENEKKLININEAYSKLDIDNIYEIQEIANKIEKNISLDVVRQLQTKYAALNEESKKCLNLNKKIGDKSILNYIENTDCDKVSELKNKIANAESKPDFYDYQKCKDQYGKLNLVEKSFINITPITDRLELSSDEKAIVAACHYVKISLKNRASFNLINASYSKEQFGGDDNYYVNLKYSATNSFGATIEEDSLQWIDCSYENWGYGIALLSGNVESALKSNSILPNYLGHDITYYKEKFDMDKFMYYLEEMY